MSTWRFIRRSLVHHWRIHVAVALGVMAATAVLTGALLVGDSVRGSLRGLALDRLGRIDALLLRDRFFGVDVAERLQQAGGFAPQYSDAVPAIVFRSSTVEKPTGDGVRRASGVLVLGSSSRFWELGTVAVGPSVFPADGEIVLNEPLAADLGTMVGDQVVLRVSKASAIPAESPLGEKEDRVRGIPRLKVVDIIPAEGLGRFSLSASQNLPRNAYVSLETLQLPLDQEGKVNAVLVAARPDHRPVEQPQCRELSRLLRPAFEDYGLSIKRSRITFRPNKGAEEETILDYFSVTTDRLVFDRDTEGVARDAFASYQIQPVSTYLANAISRISDTTEESESVGIPYSTITAVDSQPGIGPFFDTDGQPIGPLGNGELVLNGWAAEDLAAEERDRIRVVYFEPETTHGEPLETHADFTLRAIAPLTEPVEPFRGDTPPVYAERPTPANDTHLTPEVRGITDRESIGRWEVPFELTREVRPQDDEYYDNHRLTPKAFVSLATGTRLWGSRFGVVTSFRIPAPADLSPDDTAEYIGRLQRAFLEQVQQSDTTLGFDFTPIKAQGLAASRGTTPFDVLFLALSFFIILAALMLVALLFRLGIEQRASDIGLLLAVGLERRQVRRLLVVEATVVAALGGLMGIVCGAGYAWLMLAGLRTVWLGAIVTPFLRFHYTTRSLAIGYALGVLVCVLTIVWSLRQLRRVSACGLLAGRAAETPELVRQQRRKAGATAVVLLAAALVLAVAATQLGGEVQAGCFVGAGVMVLSGLLLLVWNQLRHSKGSLLAGRFALIRMAMRNASRNPSRSTVTIGLMATSGFLIIALSSFRLAPTESGTGGFDLVAESSEPVFVDMDSKEGRDEVFGQRAGVLAGGVVMSLRVQPGDDASCNNLYKAARPQVLGVTPAMIRHFDRSDAGSFSWAASAAETDEELRNPWRLLERDFGDGTVPVVIDKNTAMYGLGLYGGVREEFEYEYPSDIRVPFRVVGLLSNSVLQGKLLVGESQFERYFPDVSGYRYFLIQTPRGKMKQVAETLEEALGDQGFDARGATSLLNDLLAVQNTYLSTFQSLGALGLLLGTFGLATVQLRNVLERRSELALLRATGFRRAKLARMVLIENLLLLVGGLAVGVVAAIGAVLPHWCFGAASIPFRELTVMLAVVLIVGVLASIAAVYATVRAPLLSALRSE